MTHQKIRPHTKNLTVNAATTEPTHRLYIWCACGVMPSSGQPNPRNVLPIEQPASAVSSPTALTPSPRARPTREPVATTCADYSTMPPGAGAGSGYLGGVAYFDAATAAPPHPVARQALVAALEDGWADPGKLYTQARRARRLLDAARASAAESLGVRED